MIFRKSKLIKSTIFTLLIVLITINNEAQNTPGARYKPIIIDSTYNHTKWGIIPSDLIYNFAAYTTSFDSSDDGEIWGIPEWVAYEIKKKNTPDIPAYTRPKWMTDDALNQQNESHNDNTYAVSGTNDLKEVSGTARYVRGHMCPKATADRISMFAGFNTHTVLNAVPQLQWQNNGIWKALESESNKWAEEYEQIWVICGPVFFNKTPAVWLGQKGEVPAAVPDAIFKIIIRQDNTDIETLSFIIPNVIANKKAKFFEYLTSMDRVESLTGLTFMTIIDANLQKTTKARHLKLTKSKKRQAVRKW
jgi:endonuclease G, mitochondrial